MSLNGGRRRAKCIVHGCTRYAGLKGRCSTHESQMRLNATSDGAHTGRRRKLTPEQLAEVRRMRAAFKSWYEIARHFGVKRETIRVALKREAEERS